MFLIIDQGTTSTKVMLFDLSGKKVDSSQKSFEQIFPNNGWVEHNPEEIIGTVISCCNEIIENNPNHNICSIGITNQRETVVVWDKQTGKSLYNAIVWQDRRTESLCRDLKEKGYEELIINKIIPAYQELNTFLKDEYLPQSRDSIGLDGVPNGKEWYEYVARYHTTTNLTPDEIHDIGLNEVKRIRSEMEQIIKDLEWEGDFKSFLNYLRTSPRFYYDNGEDLLNAYLIMAKKIDPLLPKIFKVFPRAPYGVIPIPEESAPFTTTAYYNGPAKGRPGYFYANLYKPESRPKYEIPVLTVHEAVPGHHFQISLAQELENVPTFRKYLSFTAFVEGWGLYSEELGEFMGIYDDPYDKFGQLTYDMWRAIRLVVDTGMHYKGWSRDDAINLFIENTAKSKLDIENEVDRYIAWPGQALAYKIGQLKILELRQKAERELGDKYDIKDFHHEILKRGSVPLDILEGYINDWISETLDS